jgi:hypothetical protein
MTLECYAQRLLNPFRGAMHTIRYDCAEAVTLDGVHWDIYVVNDSLLADLAVSRHTQISEIRFGSWSVEKGLKRGALYPSEDFRRMEDIGAMVYQHLTRVHGQVPFAFRDCFELWLLDADCLPLALLHSVIGEDEVDTDVPIEWRAGYAAAEHFVSAVTERIGTTTSAAEYLSRRINARAGSAPAAQWFRRSDDGAGVGLRGMGLPPALVGRALAAQSFPALFLSVSDPDPAYRQLVDDYLAWQAPWLLELPNLNRATRRRLEQSARQRAFVVESQYRLYPEIVDPSAIQAALVEAMLRRSQPTRDPLQDDTLSTFYIELSPSTHE